MSELKRCPFCGGEARLICFYRVGLETIKIYLVKCSKCGFEYKEYQAEEEAIAAWNTRKPIERILERLEEESNNSINDFDRTRDYYHDGKADGFERAIRIVREEGVLNNG